MTETYVVREFLKEDIDDVMRINQTCLPENYPSSFFLGLHTHAPKAFLVALENEKVIGYIMCRIERGISSFRRAFPVKKGHIVSVAVLHDYRHRGIGRDLINRGIEGMGSYGAVEIFLEVRKSNVAAVTVYEKLGFDVGRVLKGYYRDGEDAYLMIRQRKEESEEADTNDK
ncbi:MAG: ribosomal protein S18-alanine N-acetyltransferase [Candidatus Thorarchaeota archaeon]